MKHSQLLLIISVDACDVIKTLPKIAGLKVFFEACANSFK